MAGTHQWGDPLKFEGVEPEGAGDGAGSGGGISWGAAQ